MNEYIIDKLESLGIRNLAKRVIENEDKILDLEEEIEQYKDVEKRIREYIEENKYDFYTSEHYVDGISDACKDILKILDKLKELKENQ